uniref:Histone deacetylase complex subunit SAP30 Sin3 binding domain-containing protein n=1 Tax=Romanomermis culicivorax TaxID=13658 RepID=A0A915KNL2_ROMCU
MHNLRFLEKARQKKAILIGFIVTMDTNIGNNAKFATPASCSTCCLIENSKRCLRTAGSHSYSKRMQKTVKQKRLKFVLDPKADHTLICHYHRQYLITEGKKGSSAAAAAAASAGGVVKKTVNVATTKVECDSEEEDSPNGKASMNDVKKRSSDSITVNFEQLSTSALKRYKKFFKLQLRANMSKSQLAGVIAEHFSNIPVDNEKEIMTYFIYAVKTKKNKLDASSSRYSSIDD